MRKRLLWMCLIPLVGVGASIIVQWHFDRGSLINGWRGDALVAQIEVGMTEGQVASLLGSQGTYPISNCDDWDDKPISWYSEDSKCRICVFFDAQGKATKSVFEVQEEGLINKCRRLLGAQIPDPVWAKPGWQ